MWLSQNILLLLENLNKKDEVKEMTWRDCCR